MDRFYKIGCLLAALLIYSVAIRSAEVVDLKRGSDRQVDAIMEKIYAFAPVFEKTINNYSAEIYIKGKVHIRKKNGLIRFFPTMFHLRKGVRDYMVETVEELRYTAPDQYDQKVRATVGTVSEFWEADGRLPEYFRIKVYSPTIIYDKLISPLSESAKKMYRFSLDSVYADQGVRQFKISFTPRKKSFQLVEGYLIVSDNVWSIRELRIGGHSEMFRFNNLIKMGAVGTKEELVPLHYELKGTFHLAGNVIDADYLAVVKYSQINEADYTEIAAPVSPKSKYDLTEAFTLRTDTNASIQDTALFNALRPIELTSAEKNNYDLYFANIGRAQRVPQKRKTKNQEFWGSLGEALIERYTLNLKDFGSVRCSPLLNPLLLSYSKRNGLSYKQTFRYNKLFAGDRLLKVEPRIGYNLKQKEFYWQVKGGFDYMPKTRTSINWDFGKGNPIYNHELIDELLSMPDTLFDYSKIHLDYFSNFYFRLYHTWEIVNGLKLDMGVYLHRRSEIERSRFIPVTDNTPPEVLNKFRHSYNSFAPEIKVTWTPHQYYYMNGDRKINLSSKYPTFTFDWERGIKGVINHSCSYERFEFDYQQNIDLGVMQNLFLRFGWGIFTNTEELYFADFEQLKHHNLPVDWDDEIGGVFQLLDGDWYNSSRKYVKGHLTYESPLLLLHHFNKLTQNVLAERIYFNILAMPHLVPYTEIGYGIGTHIFDLGIFASFDKLKYQEFGFKFTFELFNR